MFWDTDDPADRGDLTVLGELSLQGRFQHGREKGKGLYLFTKKGKKGCFMCRSDVKRPGADGSNRCGPVVGQGLFERALCACFGFFR